MGTTKLLLLLFLAFIYYEACSSCRSCDRAAGRHFLYNLLRTNSAEEPIIDELGASIGVCNYHFISYVSYEDMRMCYADDKNILHLLPPPGSTEQIRQPIKMFNCLKDSPFIVNNTNAMRIITSLPDIVDLLRPIGNNTKEYQSGNCVLVYFHTLHCIGCRRMTVSIMKLPFAYKTIPVAVIDAHKFNNFSTEFGIASVPTLMLFHQGRPAVKYEGHGSVIAFVNQHTGLRPQKVPNNLGAYGLWGLDKKVSIDYLIVVTWLFILTCAGLFFNKFSRI